MGRQDYETETLIAHSLRVEGFDASEDGTGRRTPLDTDGYSIGVMQPVGVTLHGTDGTQSVASYTEVSSSLRARIPSGVENSTTTAVMHPVAFHPTQDPISSTGTTHAMGTGSKGGAATVAVAFDTTQITSPSNYSRPAPGDPCHPLASGAHPPAIATPMQVRRLTPRECERLQGFPDNWTLIPWRGRPAAECPDGPRYKALGNSMAVPCMRWIGERIAEVSS